MPLTSARNCSAGEWSRIEMNPKSPAHERAIRWLTLWLVDNVERATHEVGVGCPLTLADSEPEPDFVVFERGTPTPYHPATAALAIEVAVSSLRRDLRIKAPLYAAAGVEEYWVVDLGGQRIVVHREPGADDYAVRDELGARDRLQATAVALPALDIAEQLAAAGE